MNNLKSKDIDFQELFIRISGNKDLAKRMLFSFFSSYKENIKLLNDFLEKDNFVLAKKINHKLLGVLGNLAIKNAFFISLNLGKSLENKKIDIAKKLSKDLELKLKIAKKTFEENKVF
ncbi:MAG: hypothetical protein B6I24_06235 [Bacteroidetes bacterium 4572_128]|nr:MAG: hypothetical protein B6I24_06235 [Bacteroidetes bacterium 4572_128]